ncbi:uncharacterized protein [Apostichopus japonicus]|uniref:uncharacterized protein isoform X1 n=1 Tax=Stichopus japonicus TaxID=307972 RepID=UPI003AB4ADC3
MESTILPLLLTVLSLSNAQDQNVFARAVCGNSRFCSSNPVDCDPQQLGDCNAFASWKLSSDGTKLEMGLYAQTSSYVAFGFSRSPSMLDTDVYACTANSEVIRSRNNGGYGNEPQTLMGVSDETVVQENGVIHCQFSRAVSVAGDVNFFDLSDSNGYYVIMAWDGGLTQTNNLSQHLTSNRFYEDERTDFTQVLTVATEPPVNTLQSSTSSNTESVTGATQPPVNTLQSSTTSNTGSVTGATQPTSVEMEEPSPTGSTPLHQDESLFSQSVCDQSRFCTSRPAGCDPQADNCQAFASWVLSADDTRVEFALYAKSSSYVAIGFSPTPSMDNTDVYACTFNGDVVRSRNMGYSNSDRTLVGVTNSSVTFADEIVSCRFSRVLSPSDGNQEFFDLASDNYYTIMAWAGILEANSLRQHPSNSRFVGDRVDFKRTLSDVSTSQMVTEGTGCGKTMGCFSRPRDCDPDTTCEVFSSWVANQDKSAITIELQANTDTYIAIGFSKSAGMDDSDVYACTANSEVRRSRNDGRRNTAQPLKGVSDESFTVSDGSIRCTFTRDVSLDDGDELFFDLGPPNEYTILLAWDGSLSSEGDIGIHKDRIFRPEPIDVTETSANVGAKADNTDILRRVHGSLMVLAWLCLVSLGITTARFFKALPAKLCGKPTWFAIHRSCMTLALVVCEIAFIIIIIAVGGFSTISSGSQNGVRTSHAIFGIIVTILAFVNVVMAIFRPHPGEPRRNLYNWAHWAVGTSAHLMALATILLGTVNRPEQVASPLLPTLSRYVVWIVAAFITFHAVLWIILTLYKVKQNSEEQSNDIPMNGGDNGVPPPSTSEAKQISPMMMSLYWVYASVTILITLVIIILIFIEQ